VSTLKLDPAIAVLTIPRLKLTAPVFEGTEETALDRGVGRIAGTAALGTSGNIGIAGHRDGFFRVLKDIQPGDLIQIRTPRHEEIYTVTTSKVVDRRDVNVLHPTSLPNLTLVTCYPFYFVGAAPERFIVKAVLKQQIPQTSMSHSAKKSADFPRHYRGIY
jgi:sortase A